MTGQAAQGDPNSKLNRWLKKTAAAPPPPPEPAPPPTEESGASGGSKLGRWLKKVEASAAPAAPTPDEGGSEDPVRRCCEAVRAAWKAADEAAACGGMASAEWTKLEQEKKALDNLMQMVRDSARRDADSSDRRLTHGRRLAMYRLAGRLDVPCYRAMSCCGSCGLVARPHGCRHTVSLCPHER
jgi:hypothetical protein